MRIGVYTSCLQDLPIEQVLPRLAGLGLDSVEVNVGGFIPSPHIPLERVVTSAGARSEYLALFATHQQAPSVREWAERHPVALSSPEHDRLLREMRHDLLAFSRINGALSGTPFFIALVPAYVSVLREQARTALRIGALHGRDPGAPQRPAEVLVFLDVYPNVPAAEASLERIRLPSPGESSGLRQVGGLRAWVEVVTQVLILAGFIEPSPDKTKPRRATRALRTVLGLGLWALTWIVPITFMLFMAYTCEGRTRKVFDRALRYYGDVEVDKDVFSQRNLRQ